MDNTSQVDGLGILENVELNITDFLTYDILIPLLIIFSTPLMAKLIDNALFHLEKNSKATRKLDITRQRMARSLIKALIYIVGFGLFLYSIPPLRALAVGIFAGVGVLGIVVGLAAQDSLANLVAGITLAIYQPFRLGDRVKLGVEEGIVEDITMRHTVIKTWENKRLIIPNQVLSKESIINYTISDKKILKYIDVGISYDSDIDLARRIMLEEAEKHPDFLEVIDNETGTRTTPVVRVREFAESSINLRLFFWVPEQGVGFRIAYEILENIKRRFDSEGVEIPFPYRTLVYKKDIPKPKSLKRDTKKIRS